MHNPCEIVTGGRFVCTPAWGVEATVVADVHRCYFPRRGEAQVRAGDRWWTLRPGRVYLIPGGQRVGHRCARRMELDWVHFRMAAPDAEAALRRVRGVVSWPASRWRPWRGVYEQMRHVVVHRPRRLTDQLQAMLLHHVSAMVGDALDAAPAGGDDRERLTDAVRYMDEHYLANPPLAAVAAAAHLSPVYFHRRFVRWLGVTPHAYMLRRRMDAARAALEGGASVKAAADAAGYGSVFYFSRVFRRYFGVTASAARRGGARP